MPHTHLLKVSRLEGLTDGIFAIAMTIMILNLHVPGSAPVDGVDPLVSPDLLSTLFIYVGSFIILGTHWIAMNFQLGLLDHLNRPYLWANMFYLMVICVIPFSADYLGKFPYTVHSIDFYAANLLCGSVGQMVILYCAHYFKLNKDLYTHAIRRATLQRIFLAPPFYIASIIVAHWNMQLAFVLLVAPTFMYIFPGRIDRYEGV